MQYDILIVGGGAAGFFTAINAAENSNGLKIAILERGNEVLTKVRISGGGRCNVTHAEFIPNELVKNYPRGEKELKGPFHTFMTGDTIEWFEKRNVELKIEEDGRMFPISDSSQTIIDCFLSEAKKLGISILTNHSVQNFTPINDIWEVTTNKGVFSSSKIMIATGSNPKIWKILNELGYDMIAAVPSLFTFNSNDERIKQLPGIATNVGIQIKDSNLFNEGPLLITHWGMSGPAILKLSAWGARILEQKNYKFDIAINWLQDYSVEQAFDALILIKEAYPKQLVMTYAQLDLPKRLWQSLVMFCDLGNDKRWADVSKIQLKKLAQELTQSIFKVNGKSTFKEEFVTAGGIDLKQVNFKSFESKKHPNLYFAGEVLNIDAVTGGFNFQNAWSGAYIAAKAMTTK